MSVRFFFASECRTDTFCTLEIVLRLHNEAISTWECAISARLFFHVTRRSHRKCSTLANEECNSGTIWRDKHAGANAKSKSNESSASRRKSLSTTYAVGTEIKVSKNKGTAILILTLHSFARFVYFIFLIWNHNLFVQVRKMLWMLILYEQRR